jgi:hypothetical protein
VLPVTREKPGSGRAFCNETAASRLAPQKMIQVLTGKCLAQAVSVAAELGIADLLTGSPKNVWMGARPISNPVLLQAHFPCFLIFPERYESACLRWPSCVHSTNSI